MNSIGRSSCILLICIFFVRCDDLYSMNHMKFEDLRNKSKEMFFHAYNNYMNHAYPADELMPLSCRGRYRGKEPPRGTVDEALGNFSLSLIDSLDTLFIMGEFDEFEKAVIRVIRDVSFDQNHDVSVFETNIRVIGGLLGGHVAALALMENNSNRMKWYNNELLNMSVELGNRLLPAFNTSTGLPFSHINLHTGQPGQIDHTCTACAGTLILEFAALSRFSGNPIYEKLADKALSYIWHQRNRYSDLVGTVINIFNGEWIKKESGVGAGIDSYYESLFKAYGLLGDPEYLHRFKTHYSAVGRYLGSPSTKAFPFSFLSVFMHKPSERARMFMDSLEAFWPGLQAIAGDVDAAVAHHEMLYMVHKKNGLLPEAFTTDLDVYWPHHLIRPELVESTYHLYKNTHDPYYLEVGAELLESIEKYTRVPCGFAALEDIRVMKYSDRMDSFVLAETFKYFYLLFSDPKELPIDIDRYVFTTQAHILPIGLPRTRPPALNQTARLFAEELSISLMGSCPAPDKNASRAATLRRLLMPQLLTSACPVVKRYNHLEEIRQPLRNKLKAMKELKAESTELPPVALSAATLNINDVTHLQMLRRMGIMVTVGGSGEIQLKLNRTEASSAVLGITGLKFIEEVIQLNKAGTLENPIEVIHTQTIALIDPPHFGRTRFEAGPSMFTYYPGENPPPPNTSSSSAALVNDSNDWEPVVGPLVIAEPFDACSPVYADGFLMANDQLHPDLVNSPPPEKEGEPPKRLLKDAIVLVQRGGCMFMDKAKNIKRVGARGVIVIDNRPSSTSARDKLFYMSGDSPDGKPPEEHLQLPFVFLYHEEGQTLTNAMERRWMSEKKPVVVMIAKREDSPKILSYGLRYLDSLFESKQQGEAKKSEQCYELSTSVEGVQSTCFPKKIIRVDGIHEEDADGWSMTLGPIENTHAFLSIDPSSGKVSPTNPAAWIDFLDRNWPTKNYDKNCKDLVLAVSEAALSQITEVDEVKGRQSMTKLTQTWRDRLSNCLQDLTTPEATNSESNECQKPYLQLTLNLAANNSC